MTEKLVSCRSAFLFVYVLETFALVDKAGAADLAPCTEI